MITPGGEALCSILIFFFVLWHPTHSPPPSVQMPEEQAFCVLVKIMYDYGLRALYKNNFEDLHCKFYQLERLLQVSLHLSLKLVFFVCRVCVLYPETH